MTKHQPMIRNKKHLRKSVNFKLDTSNKYCNGLIGGCFEKPNVSNIHPINPIDTALIEN